ncbi:MAG: hypothetical protein HUJ31_05700, partial [Pseudomonadales bacterium]|nr:hypothetical protein [Pseudomonadales bacterium]
MAISAWDDYLIHQSSKTVDQMESDDIDAMERLYVGCHNSDGKLHFASGLGVYPNRNVMDGYICVRRGKVQHNLRVSRHLADDRADMRVGPVSFEIIEPQRRWAVQVEDNDSGIAGRVEFTGRGPAWMTAPPSHYDQLGRFEGSIVLQGETIDVNGFIGARDRSWGVRQANLFGGQGWGGHFWIHVHFSSFCLTLVHAGIWDGNPRCGAAIIRDDGNVTPMNEMRHRIDFEEGVRALNGLEIQFRDDPGAEPRLVGTRISPAIYFNGGGY